MGSLLGRGVPGGTTRFWSFRGYFTFTSWLCPFPNSIHTRDMFISFQFKPFMTFKAHGIFRKKAVTASGSIPRYSRVRTRRCNRISVLALGIQSLIVYLKEKNIYQTVV